MIYYDLLTITDFKETKNLLNQQQLSITLDGHKISAQYKLKGILVWGCSVSKSLRKQKHTHYQRAHKKNVVHHFYAMERKEGAAFVCEMSIDDKAYLCPARSTGMRGAKNQKIFQTCDEIKARKLPKYDFPVSMVNVTPATHRFMTKQL